MVITRNLNTNVEPSHRDPRTATATLIRHGLHAVGTVRLWMRRIRQREELRALTVRDPRFFADIGVPRATVQHEAAKWFWQA